ncbi:MAG: hypothetical protein IKB73_05895 [Ruminococcus sp.]|nr:hypothetical protein [Ruminococcus sp.]
MSRYSKTFAFNASKEMLYGSVTQYLVSEGYKETDFDSERVFKKGNGIMMGPTFIKMAFTEDTVVLEAWMKFALLPGVYVSEIGLTGFAGAAVKGPLKERVRNIENMIFQCGGYELEPQPAQYNAPQYNTQPVQPTPQQAQYNAPQYNAQPTPQQAQYNAPQYNAQPTVPYQEAPSAVPYYPPQNGGNNG